MKKLDIIFFIQKAKTGILTADIIDVSQISPVMYHKYPVIITRKYVGLYIILYASVADAIAIFKETY